MLRKARFRRRPSKTSLKWRQPLEARGARVPLVPLSTPMPVDPAPAGSLVVAPVPVADSDVLPCTADPGLPLLPAMVALGGVPVAVTVVAPLVSGEAVGELAERSA